MTILHSDPFIGNHFYITLLWGARGRRFESSHSDSFSLGTYEDLTAFLKSLFFLGWWIGGG